jgi:UDP-glucose:(heptosyl)LPS alpha-1,3-glucosyltransferase
MQGLTDDICLLAIVADQLVNEALELVHKHPMRSRVKVLGALSTMELADRAADRLVHPTLEDSRCDGCSRRPCRHGVPVIVSAAEFCGISAELNDGENALILNDPRSAGRITGHDRSSVR